MHQLVVAEAWFQDCTCPKQSSEIAIRKASLYILFSEGKKREDSMRSLGE